MGVGPFIKYSNEKKTLAMNLEHCHHLMAAIMYCSILFIFILKRKEINSTYNLIQSTFICQSKEKEMDSNTVYKNNIARLKTVITPLALMTFFTEIGPLLEAINDLEKLPLDDRSHWIFFWPNVSII